MNLRAKVASSRLVCWSLLLVLLMIVAGACMSGAKSPAKSANGALAPGAAARGGKNEAGAFRVVFAGPQGEANEVSELSLVFNRPLRKLELGGAPPPVIAISPPIASVALVHTTLVPQPKRCRRNSGATSIGALRSVTMVCLRPPRSAQ